MAISKITTLPPAPLRSDPTTFRDKGDALMTALVTMVPQMNTSIDGVNAAQSSTDANSAAALAALMAANAASLAAQTTAAAKAWVSGGTYQLNDCVISPINSQVYRKKTTATANSGGATDPASDATNWVSIATGTLYRSARSSNTALAAGDAGKLIDLSGTFTQTFAAASLLGNGWFVYIRNTGTGDITLDPNASETIDGLTSFIMYPGEARIVVCDSTAFYSVVVNPFYKVFTSSGTFTKPPGYDLIEGLMWGGGGSGSKTTASYGGGGGGGACHPFTLSAAAIPASVSVTIGAGGTAVGTAGNGVSGGNSTFGTLLTSYGGGGGNGVGYGGGGGGLTSAGSISQASTTNSGGGPWTAIYDYSTNWQQYSIGGWGGGNGGNNNNSGTWVGGSSVYGGGGGGFLGAGGLSVYGGGGGGGVSNGTAYQGGTSVYGGNGGASNTTTSGVDGAAPGGGGGGTQTGTQSGAGARGELRIWGKA